MIDTAIPSELARRLRKQFGITRAVAVRPGLSGALVFQCESEDATLSALRRWPTETKLDRIQAVHHVLSASRKSCELVPRLHPLGSADGSSETVACQHDGCWELAAWLPGQPLERDASLESIAAGAAAIGKFHVSVKSLGTQRQPPPAVQVRLRRIRQLSQLQPWLSDIKGNDLAPSLCVAIQQANAVLQSNWPQVCEQIVDSLQRWSVKPVFTQYVLRDVHREHVLFVESKPSGLIDFDAIRIDTPITDLARWTGSFLADRDDVESVWGFVLAEYQRSSPFSRLDDPGELLALAKLLHRSSVWISLANWSQWLGPDLRRFPGCDDSSGGVIAERINDLAIMAIQDT